MRPRLSLAALLAASLLSGCATQTARRGAAPPEPVRVDIIAFNDFHGNLQRPHLAIDAPNGAGGTAPVPAGGVAWLASSIRQLRSETPHSVTVSAGDLIGASPLISSLFLDEPTIEAMNLIGLDFNAAGNHEFDRGRDELLRMQKGGCAKYTTRQPCAVISPFPGADFRFLAANTLDEGGNSLFPAYGIRTFGTGARSVTIGFIGLTLRGTGQIVSPDGIRGLHFADEADTANALIPRLRAAGADAIVLLIHQGGATTGGYDDKSCPGLTGDIVPILDRLDPSVDVVVSGHTHKSYICDYGRMNPARPFLLTSAGQYGTLLTHIVLDIDPIAGRILSKRADNIIVQSEGYRGAQGDIAKSDRYPALPPEPGVAALVSRYAAATASIEQRVIGHVAAPALRTRTEAGEQVLGDLIADAQLAATRSPDQGGAQVAFMNSGGIRADLVPGEDGAVTFGAIYAIQPFGNRLVTRSYSGRQLLAILEQQFATETPRILQVSASLRYGYDLTRPAGSRILDARIDGQPIDPDRVYRVTCSNFLVEGGDGFTAFAAGTDQRDGPQDIDALERHIAASPRLALPVPDRIRRAGP